MPVIFSLLDTPAFGGAEQYMVAHLKYLCQKGYSVFLATNNAEVAKQVRLRIGDLESERFVIVDAPYLLDAIGNWKGLLKYFLMAPFTILWFVRTLVGLQKKYGQMICLFPGWSDRLTFSPFVKLFGASLIWVEIGPLRPVFQRNWGFPRLLYRLTQHFPDHFVTTSQWTLESMIDPGHVDRQKISLVYPGAKSFSAREVAEFQKIGRAAKQKLSWKNAFVVGYVGRLASENQVELVIQAFSLLVKKVARPESLRLLIIGDGPERQLYEKTAQKLGIKKYIHFTGFVDEKRKYSLWAMCDVFTFTRSWSWDGFGMTTIEAMSLGIPVITSDFGPQKEIIDDRISGLHFKPNDSDSLAEKIEVLLKSPKLRSQLAKKGHERVKMFDEKIWLHKMAEIVKKVAKTS